MFRNGDEDLLGVEELEGERGALAVDHGLDTFAYSAKGEPFVVGMIGGDTSRITLVCVVLREKDVRDGGMNDIIQGIERRRGGCKEVVHLRGADIGIKKDKTTERGAGRGDECYNGGLEGGETG